MTMETSLMGGICRLPSAFQIHFKSVSKQFLAIPFTPSTRISSNGNIPTEILLVFCTKKFEFFVNMYTNFGLSKVVLHIIIYIDIFIILYDFR